MVFRSEMKLHVECDSKGPEEVRDELGSSVGSDMARDTMFGEDMENK